MSCYELLESARCYAAFLIMPYITHFGSSLLAFEKSSEWRVLDVKNEINLSNIKDSDFLRNHSSKLRRVVLSVLK